MHSQGVWTAGGRRDRLRKLRAILLSGGIAAPVLYAAINLIVPMADPSYDWRSQAVSELSAIGAPTRSLWIWLCLPYSILMAGFGIGIWMDSGRHRTRRVIGAIVALSAIIGILWPPMHQRTVLAAGGGTVSDTLHIAFTMLWGAASLTTMLLGALSLGGPFRFFTACAALATVLFGVLTGLDSPNMESNLPTPMMGVYERIGMGASMLWTSVFACVLLAGRSEDP